MTVGHKLEPPGRRTSLRVADYQQSNSSDRKGSSPAGFLWVFTETCPFGADSDCVAVGGSNHPVGDWALYVERGK